MSELYDNLLKATNNINDITTEKIGIITQLNGDLCNVKEENADLEQSQSMNMTQMKTFFIHMIIL